MNMERGANKQVERQIDRERECVCVRERERKKNRQTETDRLTRQTCAL
jgi:hypothetical protein